MGKIGDDSVVHSESTHKGANFRRLERGLIAEEWRHMALLNYKVSPELLAHYVPRGMELDSSDGITWLSLVGLVFRTDHFFRIPLNVRSHVQIQLRFYVKFRKDNGWRPGQMVIRELGNRNALLHPSAIQSKQYRALQMMRSSKEESTHLRYFWNVGGKWNFFSLNAPTATRIVTPESREAFITQRLWDYTVCAEDCVNEIQIKHPSWRYSNATRVRTRIRNPEIFGAAFAEVLQQDPAFSIIAEGSPVLLCRACRVSTSENQLPSSPELFANT